jgi:hypothetical protein
MALVSLKFSLRVKIFEIEVIIDNQLNKTKTPKSINSLGMFRFFKFIIAKEIKNITTIELGSIVVIKFVPTNFFAAIFTHGPKYAIDIARYK